jgi:hypothetical protein
MVKEEWHVLSVSPNPIQTIIDINDDSWTILRKKLASEENDFNFPFALVPDELSSQEKKEIAKSSIVGTKKPILKKTVVSKKETTISSNSTTPQPMEEESEPELSPFFDSLETEAFKNPSPQERFIGAIAPDQERILSDQAFHSLKASELELIAKSGTKGVYRIIDQNHPQASLPILKPITLADQQKPKAAPKPK